MNSSSKPFSTNADSVAFSWQFLKYPIFRHLGERVARDEYSPPISIGLELTPHNCAPQRGQSQFELVLRAKCFGRRTKSSENSSLSFLSGFLFESQR